MSSLRVGVLSIAMVGMLTAGWVIAGDLIRDVPPLAVAAVRTATTFPVLALLVLLRPAVRTAAGTAARRGGSLVVLAGAGFLAYYGGTMFGVARIGAAATGVVVGLLPCLTLVIGVVAFGGRADAARLGGTALAVGAAVTYGVWHAPSGAALTPGGVDAVIGVALALGATAAYALYGHLYRRLMGDLPSLASLPGITAVATVMLLPLAMLVPGGLGAALDHLPMLVFLGVFFTAPVFLIAHELMLARGPLFTNSVAVVVPFLIRVTEWALGRAPGLEPWELVLIVLAAIGVLTVVRSRNGSEE